MAARIVTGYRLQGKDRKHDSNKGNLKLDFDEIKQAYIYLDMTAVNVPKGKEIIWNVYSDGELLDVGDLTKGKKAEFIMDRSYAGTFENPHIFTIRIKTHKNEELINFNIEVFAKPKITEAYWADKDQEIIQTVSIFDPFIIGFKGYGIYKRPLNLKCFLKAKDGKDIEMQILPPYILTDFEYQSDYLYVDPKTLIESPMFFYEILKDNIKRFWTEVFISLNSGRTPNLKIVKAYFQISDDKGILYNGETTEKGILEIVFDINSLKAIIIPAKEISTHLSPATIYSEEYFTQKYEPCKFEKIYFKYAKDAEKKIFDEKEATKKANKAITISAIVPPAGSKNIQELKIRLDGVDTKDCSLTPGNKALTSGAAKDDEEHGGKVIDTEELDAAKIDYILKKTDKEIIIAPSFNYEYDKDTAKEFIWNYFLFSGMLDNVNPIISTSKGGLMDREAKSKGIIDTHRIALNTCRYKKSLYLKTYADVAWAFHALIDDPYLPEYYNGNADILTVQGLNKELDWVKNDPIFNNFVAPILSPALQIPFIRNFIFEIIKDIADKYEFGLTAYYDFDTKGKKNDKQIDYAETHPEFFKALVAGFTTLEILIDVLLIVLTEGAALANFVSKSAKVSKVLRIKKKADRIGRVGRSADRILSRYSTVFSTAKGAQYAKSTFEMMKGSYYRAYRYVEDKEMRIHPLLEERVKISPLINLGVSQKKTLGALLLDKTSTGKALNMVIDVTGGFQLGVSALFIGKLGKKGKSAVSWGKAATYPLKVVNTISEGTYELLAFATDEAVKKVFGAEAEVEKDITAHMDMDFWLKIDSARKKIDLHKHNGKKYEVSENKYSVSIAPSGAFTVRIKISGSVASNGVMVRAMNILTWQNKEGKFTELEGKFEVEGNVFIERRYFFEEDNKNYKPYHQDRVVFTGLGGEYMYKTKVEVERKESEKKIIAKVEEKEEIKQFMLLEPCEIGFDPSDMTKNPAEK